MKDIKKKYSYLSINILLIICTLVIFGCGGGGGGGDDWEGADPGTNTGNTTPDQNPDGTITYYQDQDGDGFGNPDATLDAENMPTDYVTNSNDCNDTDITINPQNDINIIDYGTFDSPPIAAKSRQWRTSNTAGGDPINGYDTVVGTGDEFIPNFELAGNYYVVCEATYEISVGNEATIISNEVLIQVGGTTGDPIVNINPELDPLKICSNSITPRSEQSINIGTDGITLKASRSPVVRTWFHAENAITKDLVTDFSIDDIIALEGDTEITCDESFKVIQEGSMFYRQNIVLMIDISTSITEADLAYIKTSAQTLVDSMDDNGRMKIVTFDGELHELTGIFDESNTYLFHDFQSKAELNGGSIIDDIGDPRGSSTNLYEAVIFGANRCNHNNNFDGITETFLVLITDGTETSQSSTLAGALAAVQGMSSSGGSYTVGVGNDTDMSVLNQLGTKGSFHIENFSELTTQLESIQEIMDAESDKLFFLEYASPVRVGNINITINTVNNCVSDSISGTFNADNFHAVSDLEIYWVNDRNTYCNP